MIRDDSADKILCEVTFISRSDPTERRYRHRRRRPHRQWRGTQERTVQAL